MRGHLAKQLAVPVHYVTLNLIDNDRQPGPTCVAEENFNISLKMKADKKPKVGAIKSFTGTKSEYKRAVFV
jgi:hypothetical protein